MGKYTDEDGIDGPFERAMRAAERDDERERKARLGLQRAMREAGYTVGAVGGAVAPARVAIPGALDTHRWITDECRANRGDEGAAKQAIESAHRAVATLLDAWPKGKGVRIHVVVTVEAPKEAR